IKHCVFRATRIHVWKICEPTSSTGTMTFQFEYLVDKDSFEWITLLTEHAILISMLIHSMGAEILHERNAAVVHQSGVANVLSDKSDLSKELDTLGVCQQNDIFTTITVFAHNSLFVEK
ncbi:hypothetical protein DICVIV_13745, partial [Dictyocaulus viviparus]